MTLAVKKRSKKAGLSPGTLIHIGHAYEDSSRLRLMRYDEAALVEKENFSPGELIEEKKKPGVLWVHLDGLRDIGRLEEIGRIFGLHPQHRSAAEGGGFHGLYFHCFKEHPSSRRSEPARGANQHSSGAEFRFVLSGKSGNAV